jgi:hypothetical protein
MGWDRRTRFLLALFVFAGSVFGLAGCGGGGGSSSSGGSSSTQISGVVQDRQSNDPIPGATIKVGSATTKTDANGSFSLSVAPGNLTVTITAPGYQTGTFSAVADEGLRTNIGVLTLLNGDTNPPAPPV